MIRDIPSRPMALDREDRMGLTSTGSSRPRRKALWFSIRAFLGLAVIGLLAARSNIDKIAAAISRAGLAWIALALLLMLLGVFVSALRWQIFAMKLGFRRSLVDLFRLYLGGLFFNSFLPTGLGGDAYKALRLRKERSLGSAAASVVLDRLSGLVGLGLVGAACAGARLAQGDHRSVTVVAEATAVSFVLGGAALALWGQRFTSLSHSWFFPRLTSAEGAVRAFVDAWGDLRSTGMSLAVSLVFQVLLILVHVALLSGLGLDIPILAIVGVVLVASLAALVPFTVNGLGVREAAYVWGLGSYGVRAPQALVFSLLLLGLMLATSAIGAVVYVTGGGRHRETGG